VARQDAVFLPDPCGGNRPYLWPRFCVLRSVNPERLSRSEVGHAPMVVACGCPGRRFPAGGPGPGPGSGPGPFHGGVVRVCRRGGFGGRTARDDRSCLLLCAFPHAPAHGTPTPLPHPRPIPFPTDFAARHTFFPLTGQHARLACTDCHQSNRFAGTPRSCMVCHQADRPSTSAWKPAHFTHRFPLNHGGANGVCSTCHPSGTASYTCSACHRPAHMRAEHAEEGIYNIAGRCAVCHPTGREVKEGGLGRFSKPSDVSSVSPL